MKIYTKTGDTGETGLFAGPRVRKDHARIEAYGTVDELNAAIGLARCEPLPAAVEQTLSQVQNDLFAVGAELATPDPSKLKTGLIGSLDIQRLEDAIDSVEASLPPLTQFILPAGSRGAALLHVARSLCRRAERRIVTLAHAPDASISGHLLTYLNRLADYLFVASRLANHAATVAEIPWKQPGKPQP